MEETAVPNKPKVVLYHPASVETVRLLRSRFDLVQVESSNSPEFLEAIRDAEGLIGMGLKIPTSALHIATKLKAIATISTGYDSFDVPWLTQNKIALINLYDPLTETTADLAFALLLATARRLTELERRVRAGEWSKDVGTAWFGIDLHHKTLGIVGMGRIGSAIAKRASLGFGMNVLYTSRTSKPLVEAALGAQRRDLSRLMAESDFVCIVVPLSDETRKLIGEKELRSMKSTAILVNIARGPVVDESALYRVLSERSIYGAGLDVFEKEPLPVDSPLLTLDNVVLAPHIGSATQETRDAMAHYAAESLIGWLIDGQPRCVVNPEVLSTR